MNRAVNKLVPWSVIGVALSLAMLGGAPAQGQQPSEPGQPKRENSPQRPASDNPESAETEVVVIHHTNANELAPQIAQIIGAIRVAVDERSNRLILSAAPEVLKRARELVAALDTPVAAAPSGAEDRMTDFLRSPVVVTGELMQMIQSVVSRDARITHHDQLMAVSGKPADVEAVRRVLNEVARDVAEATAVPATRPLRVSFSYLIGAVGAAGAASGGGAALPVALEPVAKALNESGFGQAELLAPVEVFLGDSGREFQLRGSARRGGTTIEIEVQGMALMVARAGDAQQGHVQLVVSSKLVATREAAPSTRPTPVAAPYRNELFQLQTTIEAPIGEYVVLAASPSSMGGDEAVALVVRVTEAK